MRSILSRRALVIAAALGPAVLATVRHGSAAGPEPAGSTKAYREIIWDDLVPKDWDPMKPFRERSTGVLNDADPRANQMLQDMRALWDNAPTVQALDGEAVKLPGYVVPLEETGGALKEFLLVPYFGACIHVPPPPANQIIHVVADKPVKGFRTMDTVWVSGTLHTFRNGSVMGVSGYRMDASIVDRYVPPAR